MCCSKDSFKNRYPVLIQQINYRTDWRVPGSYIGIGSNVFKGSKE